ncbi:MULTISPECIES: hypothetical protein [unclassified Corynebacterium]|uniref:hypothetical protein n=1 Tax=unclassified Corynebacterium TaxID=2624378 RepID=UPI0029CA178F|nr:MULTISPECIES: hypothetical protein [unclassified Corynebacterium]WPF65533.1 hypothetical protein OLX12_08090 [Corynebacterium sp. 22KM0430]WPF68028.1 hypothetical protein OLW90_08085 [Corynebacterium sp. 21KM1197]
MAKAAEGVWVWQGNELIDANGQTIASVRSDVLYCGEDRLLIESASEGPRFRARATSMSGGVFTITQAGFTVQRLQARCMEREYELVRSSLWRKQRIITSEGTPLVVVRPLISGRVEIEKAPEAPRSIITLDAVFLSWGCVLVDSPVRRPRLSRG